MKKKPTIYQIIITRNREQIKYISSFKNVITANSRFQSMVNENKSDIIFPVRYVNTRGIKPVEYEIILIKSVEEGENPVSMVKNDVGGYIETTVTEKYSENSKYGKVNKDKFIVFEKEKYNIEEKFWVYGYHPRFQRKTFKEIYGNLIYEKLKGKKFASRITVFKNKLLIESEDDIDIVICKCIPDSIRFYNLLNEWCERDKIHNIIWNGKYKKSQIKFFVDKITHKTGWKKDKIMRNSTRP